MRPPAAPYLARRRRDGPRPPSEPTHMIVGAIAYDVLKQDSPATIARVLELLKSHPEYDTRHALPDCADRRP